MSLLSRVFIIGLISINPVTASATSFVLTNPGLELTWGHGPDGVVAPNDKHDGSSDITGPDAARSYVAAMLAAAPSLDEAASFHWFELTSNFLLMHGVRSTSDLIGSQIQQQLKNKQEEVQQALLDELDARFSKLTTAMQNADSIVLPKANSINRFGLTGPVLYCAWIVDRARSNITPLGNAILVRCLQDRDIFLNKLVEKLADLVPLPNLSSSDKPLKGATLGETQTSQHSPNSPLLSVDEPLLSRAVLSADQKWPSDYALLSQAYGHALQSHFEASQDQLFNEVRQAVQEISGSDVIHAAEEECHTLLGPYAGILAQHIASASVAGKMHDVCITAINQHIITSLVHLSAAVVSDFDSKVAETKRDTSDTILMKRTFDTTCQVALQPYFPGKIMDAHGEWSLTGLDQAQAAGLKSTCAAAVASLNTAIDQHNSAGFVRIRAAIEAEFNAKTDETSRDTSGTITMKRMPDMACQVALQPYFSEPTVGASGGWSLSGLDHAQAADLENACILAAGRLNTAVDHHNATSLAQIRAAVVAEFDGKAATTSRDTTGTTRISNTPETACKIALQRRLPKQAMSSPDGWPLNGLDHTQAADLESTCVAAAERLSAAVVSRHIEDAVLLVNSETNMLAAWDAVFWLPGGPGDLNWITGEDAAAVLVTKNAFRAAYEARIAPIRTAAVQHFVNDIQKTFTVATGIESPSAAELCVSHYRNTNENIMQSWFGVQPDEAAVSHAIDDISVKSILTAQEAQYWVANLCRSLHEKTIARRVSLAVDRAGIPSLFKNKENLAVPSPQGGLRSFDPYKLVKAAAVDGLQLTFTSSGIWRDAEVRVTPFGQTNPVLKGTIQKATRADGVTLLEVVDLASLQGMDGPLATIECVGTPVQEAYRQGRAGMLRGYALAFFDDLPVTGGLLAEEARQNMLDVQACDAAKKSFIQSRLSP